MRSRAAALASALGLLVLGHVVFSAGPVHAVQEVVGDEPPHANEAVFPLLDDLASEDPSRRIAAVMALRELGPVAWPAIPALTEALSDPIMPVRKGAAGALGGIGPTADASVPALRRALGDPHRFVRSWAAMALFEIGPGAASAVPDLIQMLESDIDNLRGRSWCASALPRLAADPDLAVPALRRALASDPSEEVRAVAVLSLAKYENEASRREGALSLLEALADPHWKVRGNAACNLPAMGHKAEIALSQLAAALRDETPYVRGCAVRALGELAPRAGEFASEVEPLLEDEDGLVRSRARQALRRLRAGLEPGDR